VTAIGRRGAMRRMRRAISPSGSSQSSITIAPCRSRNTASQPARTASSIGRTSVSKVSRDALFDGHDSAATGVTTSAPSRFAMSRYAASGVLVPRKRAAAAAPNAGPSPWPNDLSGVGIGENVLVSCLTSART
jgi:hypothetical protein